MVPGLVWVRNWSQDWLQLLEHFDFKAVYDTIDRNELWSIMQRYHFSGKLIRLLEATMNGVQCKVRV